MSTFDFTRILVSEKEAAKRRRLEEALLRLVADHAAALKSQKAPQEVIEACSGLPLMRALNHARHVKKNQFIVFPDRLSTDSQIAMLEAGFIAVGEGRAYASRDIGYYYISATKLGGLK